MSKRSNMIMVNTAKAGARGVETLIGFALKILGTLFLVFLTTGAVFACIFMIYLKTSLPNGTDVRLEELVVNESSILYYPNASDPSGYSELRVLANIEHRICLDYEEIPRGFVDAVVSIEDQRFWDHNGVDWFRTSSAFVHMFLGSSTFGGSTITQQLIKNITGNDDVTVQRKLQELFTAIEFEKIYSKEEILEAYLNQVYFGSGCYGIEAASEYYFNKTVGDLSIAEIASIIGITNNPSIYGPFASRENNKKRQETILLKMLEQGYITQKQYEEEKARPLVFTGTINSGNGDDVDDNYTWFIDALYYQLIDDIMEQRQCSEEIAKQLLLNGGLRIYTTFDPHIQACMDEVYEDVDNLPYVTGSSQQVQSAMVIMDPYTGDVKALVGGVGDKQEQGSLILNRATQTTRAPGSSIKPIASYGPAMEYGLITPDTKFLDAEEVTLTGTDWMPRNDSGTYNGVVTIRSAIISSLNTIAAQLIDMLTPETSYEFLENNAGITTLVPDDDCSYSPLALGELTNGATVMDMTSAYSMFPNGGMRSAARMYTHITDTSGNIIIDNGIKQNAAISEKTAYWMTNLLQSAAYYGTGYEAYLDNMPTAGKTGTSSSQHDRWFVGFTPYYVAACWTGYDIPVGMSVSGNPSSQIWYRVMSRVHESLEYKEFSVPEDTSMPYIPGVEEIDYFIIAVDESGREISREAKSSVDKMKIDVKALEITDYELIGDNVQTIIIDKTKQNIVTFKYKSTREVSYTVIAMSEDGKELSRSNYTAIANTKVTVNASNISGYTLTSAGSQTITIGANGGNIVTFWYKSNAPAPTPNNTTTTP